MRNFLTIAILCQFLAVAQTYPNDPNYPPGQYPPGRYPPGQYPPGQYPGTLGGIPWPHINFPKRKPKTKTDEKKPDTKESVSDSDLKINLATVEGTLRKMGEKDLLLETSPTRILRFRLLAKTQFRDKDSAPMRDSLIHPGDRLAIHVNADDAETALRVVLVSAGTAAEREAAARPAEQASAETAAVTPGPEDLSHPTAVIASTTGEDRPSIKASDDPNETPRHPSGNSPDQIIDDAREAAASFTADLPNFLVQQVTTRYQSVGFPVSWQRVDVVTSDVTCVDGKEDYRNILVNGRQTSGPIESTGSWSTGEFSVTLEDIMSPLTAAVFTKRGEEKVANRAAIAFDLSVEHANSHWTIVAQDGRRYSPAYKGTVWIDKDTRRVLRIEQQASGMPGNFPYDKAESTLEYGYVMIDGKNYLLPIKSENLACMRGRSCSRNTIDFKNYRKFNADSKISF